METYHYNHHRANNRQVLINMMGLGDPVKTVLVDRGHANGAELHTITSNALIYIENANTHRHITTLIARPGQIKRYYTNEPAPAELIAKARHHEELGYNEW